MNSGPATLAFEKPVMGHAASDESVVLTYRPKAAHDRIHRIFRSPEEAVREAEKIHRFGIARGEDIWFATVAELWEGYWNSPAAPVHLPFDERVQAFFTLKAGEPVDAPRENGNSRPCGLPPDGHRPDGHRPEAA